MNSKSRHGPQKGHNGAQTPACCRVYKVLRSQLQAAKCDRYEFVITGCQISP